MDLPGVNHLLFIPGILLVGITIGYVMGARATRAELDKRAKERKR